MKTFNAIMTLTKLAVAFGFNMLFLNAIGVDHSAAWAVAFTVAQVIVAVTMPAGALGDFLNPVHFTFNGREIDSLSKIIFEEAFKLPQLREFHRVQTGIVAREQIGYLGHLGLVGVKYNGCAPSHPTVKADGREKFWEPAPIFTRTIECWNDMLPSFLAWAYNNGIKRTDISSTEVARYIVERLTIAQREALFRIAYFGDTTADNQANGSYLINSIQPSFFTPINGFWNQAFAIVISDPTKYVNIAKNSGGSYTAQLFDPTDTANKTVHQIFSKMLRQADYRLKEGEDRIFIVTYSIYEQYLEELKTYVHTEAAFRLVQEGQRQLMYDGVPIYPFSQWDRIMRTYYDDGSKWLNAAPHRAILTTRTNLAIGIEEESAFTTFNVFHDQITHNLYTDSMFMLDAKVIRDELCIFAY